MGLLDIFKRSQKRETLSPPVDDELLKALIYGEAIDREKAMTVPAVSSAVDFIASSVAAMPVKLYKVKKESVEEVTNDTRTRLLNLDTEDTLDAFQLKKNLVADYLMDKGGYCYIQRYRNEVTGLYYVAPIHVTLLRNFEPVFKKYVIEVQGKTYKPWEFVKLLRNTIDGAEGVGLTLEVAKAIETAYAILKYQLRTAQTGGSKRGFIKSDRQLSEDAIEKLKTAWREMYAETSENVVILNNGLQFQDAGSTALEMQINESKRTLDDEIKAIFHIYDNDFERTFKEAIYPVVKAFETALNRDLLTEAEKKNHFFELDVKEILRMSLKDRYDAYRIAKETGFMTLNEIRRAENMNRVEGMDVVNVGLGAVLYDTETHTYFTPNTGETVNADPGAPDTAQMEKLIEDKEIDTAFEQSGNSAEE